jgi:hypothetical protein
MPTKTFYRFHIQRKNRRSRAESSGRVTIIAVVYVEGRHSCSVLCALRHSVNHLTPILVLSQVFVKTSASRETI